MNWGQLFFKFDGRINRALFWIASLILVWINIILTVIGYLADQSQSVVFQSVNGMLNLVILIVSIAVGIKRLHDRNKSGWYLLLFYFAPCTLAAISVLIGTFVDESTVIATVLALLALTLVVWAFIEMGCLRGTIGINQYGSDPVAPATIPPVRLPT